MCQAHREIRKVTCKGYKLQSSLTLYFLLRFIEWFFNAWDPSVPTPHPTLGGCPLTTQSCTSLLALVLKPPSVSEERGRILSFASASQDFSLFSVHGSSWFPYFLPSLSHLLFVTEPRKVSGGVPSRICEGKLCKWGGAEGHLELYLIQVSWFFGEVLTPQLFLGS